MRVLQLTDLYYPVVGGLERFVEIVAAGLAERGHEVAVATGASALAGAGRSEYGGLDVHRLTGWQHTLLRGAYASADRPFHPTAPDPGMMKALAGVVREFRPDVIHAHSWNVLSILPMARRLGVPVVVQAHDYGLVCHRKTMMRDKAPCPGPALHRCVPCGAGQYGAPRSLALAASLRASRPLLARAARVTAVSRYVAQRLDPVLRPLTGRPVEVLHSFVPDGLAAIARASEPPPMPAGDVVLFVGALTSVKGLTVLLDAHARMTRRVPLVLMGTRQGDTPDPSSLPPGVHLHADVPHARVMAAMARAAVVVAPSLWPDPLPMTVSEAQLVGTPVVASRAGGIPEQVLDGQTGLLVTPGDAGQLAGALDELLADPQRRARMGRLGASWAQRFTAEAGLGRVEDVLGDAAASPRLATDGGAR